MKLENVLPCFVAAPLLIPNSLNWECYSTWALISLFYPEKSFNQSVLLAGHRISTEEFVFMKRSWLLFQRHRSKKKSIIDLKLCWFWCNNKKKWPSLPFCFPEYHFSRWDTVITLRVVLCRPLYIRFCSLRAFGNIIMCSHYCRHHKARAGNELVSTFSISMAYCFSNWV